MRSLTSELASHVAKAATEPRVYADANLPVGLVAFMRTVLGWDVFFVMEHHDLRRAPDERHYALAREMRRTLLSLDRDYTDDRRFPPASSGGVIIVHTPDAPPQECCAASIAACCGPIIRRALLSADATFDLPLAGRELSAPIPTGRERIPFAVYLRARSLAAPDHPLRRDRGAAGSRDQSGHRHHRAGPDRQHRRRLAAGVRR